MTLSGMAKTLWAKKSRMNGGVFWLPLYAHMSDTAGTARFIWNEWLPEGTKRMLASNIFSAETGFGDEDCARELYIFLAAAHDIGKASPVFQSKESFVNRELDLMIADSIRAEGLPLKQHSEYVNRACAHHSLVSELILDRHGFDKGIGEILGAHHGKPPNEGQISTLKAFSQNSGFSDEKWSAVQKELLDYAIESIDLNEVLPALNVKKTAKVIMSGLIILADWIASDENLFPYVEITDEVKNPKTRAAQAWDMLGLTPCRASEPFFGDPDAFFKKRFDIGKPRQLQVRLLEIARNLVSPGLVIVEAPTGEGKTEAALAAAEILAQQTSRCGLYFALPTQATSDAMFARILRWLDRLDDTGNLHSILLAHGKADFNADFMKIKLSGQVNVGDITDEENENVVVHEWLSGRKKTMLADFVIGTIDHILMAGLKQKHLMLRHLGLANKVVIIDECHAYDAYMSRYLYKVMNWLGAYKVPVIMLSATLPAGKRREIISAYLNIRDKPKRSGAKWKSGGNSPAAPEQAEETFAYPLITFTEGREVKYEPLESHMRNADVAVRYLPDDALQASLNDFLSEGGCAGIIVNTVKRAQDTYELLSERFGEDSVRLLHSRFISSDRTKKEHELVNLLGPGAKRPKKLIVVGTQVLEQSLDIDFDLLVTDICPMDLLIQRIGRLHRHKRNRPMKLKKAVCLITGVTDEGFDSGAEAIYGKYLLMRTKAFMPSEVIHPDFMSDLVQDVYGEKAAPVEPALAERYESARREHESKAKDKKQKAGQYQISDPVRSENTLLGWLDMDISDKLGNRDKSDISDKSGKRGEATVRDGEDSVEAIVVMKKNGKICLLPWIGNPNGAEIPRDGIPHNDIARVLAGCSVRLPSVFGKEWMADRVISELEEVYINENLHLWQKSKWLKGELLLVLDEKLRTKLCGYSLRYDREYGLIYEKQEGRYE
ncbi:MAG: CRISPR-associated helicase Cas3' [Clostridiales bacterium]|nr:CRISPR-associated helicase Cas3' [Clostridiales bacterium]